VRLLELQAVVATWSLVLFPGVAVLLRRRLVLLWSATGIALSLTLWFAAFAASVPKDTLPAESATAFRSRAHSCCTGWAPAWPRSLPQLRCKLSLAA